MNCFCPPGFPELPGVAAGEVWGSHQAVCAPGCPHPRLGSALKGHPTEPFGRSVYMYIPTWLISVASIVNSGFHLNTNHLNLSSIVTYKSTHLSKRSTGLRFNLGTRLSSYNQNVCVIKICWKYNIFMDNINPKWIAICQHCIPLNTLF